MRKRILRQRGVKSGIFYSQLWLPESPPLLWLSILARLFWSMQLRLPREKVRSAGTGRRVRGRGIAEGDSARVGLMSVLVFHEEDGGE